MSYQPLWLRDLVAYSIQAAALVGVGVIMARVLQLRMPRVRHAYWQALLAVCVLLPLLQPWRPEVLESSGAALTNVSLVAAPASAPAGPSIGEIVIGLICAGIVLRILWMALGFGRLWLYRRRAQRMQAPQAVEEAQRLAPATPAFFISCEIPTPATFGFFRPAVLFPARFLEMEPAMQKAIALHELLHVERHDWLWNMFEELVLTVLWFHLPLWWVVRSARLSREQVVDAEAIRRSNARRPYLKALLEMAGQKRLAESLPAPLFLLESQLAERVALMMKEVHMSRTRLTVSIVTAAGTLLIAGATLVWAFPLKTSSVQAKAPAVASTPVQAEAGGASAGAPSQNVVAAKSEANPKIGKVYKVGGKVSAPIPIYKPEPPYTPKAMKAHLEGTLVLWAVIDTKGRVVEVEESSKPLGQGLDESAMNTVRTWKFNPATRMGVAVPVKVMIEVSFRAFENGKPNPTSQNSAPAYDPLAQGNANVSANANDTHKAYINQKEIQRQVDEAMKQAKIAQDAASKIDQKKLQEQIDEAMMQAKVAQKSSAEIDQAKIQQQIYESMKKAQIAQEAASKVDQVKTQQQVNAAIKQLQKVDTPEMRRKYEEALKQLKAAQMTAPKIDQTKLRQQVEQAMEQAKIAQQDAAKVNKAEIQHQLDEMRKQVEQARKEAEAARKEVEKAHQKAMKDRREAEGQGKAIKPEPPAAPAPPPAPPRELKPSPVPPVPPSSEMVTPTPPSPASPTPPSPPQN